MKQRAKALAVALTALAVPFLLFAAGEDAKAPQGADVSVAKPASSEDSGEAIPPFTQNVAKLAAIMAVAFDKLPDATFDKESARVVWGLSGQFRAPGVRYDRYSAFMQIDGRTYAGVDFASQNGSALTMQGFELETPETGSSPAKVKVVEKDSASSSFFVFDRADIEKEAEKAIQTLAKAQPQN